MLECGLFHEENGYVCKQESWSFACLKMAIRYDSEHRGFIYLLISLFTFFFFNIINITIANSFVENGENVASAAVLPGIL